MMNPGTNVTLSGSWDNNNITLLRFVLAFCDQKVNADCKSQNETLNFISENGLNINFFYPRYSLQLENYENPVSSRIAVSFRFMTSYLKYSYFYVNINEDS